MSRTRILLWIVLAALAVAAALALHAKVSPDSSLDRIRKTGSIRIGYAVEAPHAYLTPEGEVTGQSPEVARRVVARLGINQIEWRLAEFGALITELREGRIDVVAAGMFITPERAALVNFSEPIFHVRPALLVARGNPRGLHSYRDALIDGRVRLAVLSGAVESDALRRAGLDESQLVMVPDAHTGRVAVETGLADGLALSSPTIQWMARRHKLGKTEIARPFEPPGPEFTGRTGYGAFAFRKEDKALLAAWNVELRELTASREYPALMHGFGFGPDELPGNASLKEILAR